MTHATEMMVHYGHVKIISRDPLTLQGITPTGTMYLRDTKVTGIAGYVGIRKVSLTIDDL